MAGRTVVLICGPPGAGKTTKAKRLEADDGLQVFDLDDPEWGGSQKNFNAALRQIGTDPAARAVVIRAGATLSARQKAADMVGATTVEVLAVDAETCRKRIVERKRERPSLRTQIAAVRFWWQNYEPGAIFLGPLSPDRAPRHFLSPRSQKSARGNRSTTARGYGHAHQKLRKRWAKEVAKGTVTCPRCGRMIEPGESWDLGHADHDRRRYVGPEHAGCNRATAGRGKVRQSRRW
jgi:hypothetical protein